MISVRTFLTVCGSIAGMLGLICPAYAQGPGFHSSSLGTLTTLPTDTYYDGSDGTLFNKVLLPAGATALQFSATGSVITAGGGPNLSPDGLDSSGNAEFNFTGNRFAGTYQGTPIGSTTGTDPALFGVFFSPSFVGTPADSLNYRSDSGITPDPRTLSSYSPSLNQPFFIGDGLTGNNAFGASPSGAFQTFNIPAGATYLLLGSGADPVLGDNSGPGYSAVVFDNSSTSVPEPGTLALLAGAGVTVGGFLARRKRR